MILFVDDDRVLVKIVNHVLTRQSYPVTTMNSGNSAIEWLKKKEECNLIITDIHMMNGSGIDLIMWQKEHRSNIPVVVVTGDQLQNLHEMEQFCEIMHLPIISKPFTTGKLLQIMKSHYHRQLLPPTQ